VGKFSMMANSRARAQDDAEGIVKFVADAGGQRLVLDQFCFSGF
jgi:pyruvate/2-oxoglutarate dehydrogenase complex dihydrolipoamide dehydrogenase (E3) component